VKGLKRARSPSPTTRRKPPTQSSSSHVSPNKRFQSSQKSRSRSPAVVQEANFALSQEIFSIIEKLQEAKTETAPNNPPPKEETSPTEKEMSPTKDKTATKDAVPNKDTTEKVRKLPKNIVANYSSEFEEISDEEMTLAEDCLNEPGDTKNVDETKSYIHHKKETEKMLKETFDLESTAMGEINTSAEIKVPTEDITENADGSLSVFWNLNCSCCGANLKGSPTEDDQHYEDGECKKKSDWLKQGLPLICAYCSQSGSHWVAACPLLASFCFTCWTWGHSMDTHMVKKEEEGEKYIARLLACYNRFRLNHLANTGRSEQYKVFPTNSKVDGMWRFTGSMEDVEIVSKKIPGHMGKPVGWLVKENWEQPRGMEIKK